MPKKERRFKYLLEKSYLAYIQNSPGTRMFRTFYVTDEKGKTYDVLKNGSVSCAVFVTTVLRSFGLVEKLHFTCGRTVDDLVASGWKQVKEKDLKPGDVIIWEAKKDKAGLVPHIGFYAGKKEAVSNSSSKGEVEKHHCTYNGTRKIEKIYRPNWKK